MVCAPGRVWSRWYRETIPLAERRYAAYRAEKELESYR